MREFGLRSSAVGAAGVRDDHDHDRHRDLIADQAQTWPWIASPALTPSRVQHGTVLAAVNAAPRVHVTRVPVRRALTAAARSAGLGNYVMAVVQCSAGSTADVDKAATISPVSMRHLLRLPHRLRSAP